MTTKMGSNLKSSHLSSINFDELEIMQAFSKEGDEQGSINFKVDTNSYSYSHFSATPWHWYTLRVDMLGSDKTLVTDMVITKLHDISFDIVVMIKTITDDRVCPDCLKMAKEGN